MQKSLPKLILYIHGWASSGLAIKAIQLKKNAPNCFAPTLPVNADLAMNLLEDSLKILIPFYQITLVGSSLGGYYSIYLANKLDLKAVLINPAMEPYDTLRKALGENKNFDGSIYTLTEDMLQLYKKYRVEKSDIKNPQNLLVMLQKGDEILDYQVAADHLAGCNLQIEEGGSHAFDGFEQKIEQIVNF